MRENLNFNKTKQRVDRLIAQAKDSMKVLDALQKEGVARARALLHVPSKDLAQKLTNEKVVASLRKIGLASRSEVRELEKKVEELAAELRTQISQVQKAAKKSAKTKAADDSHSDANA